MFHSLDCMFPLFVGGFGCGKTETMCNQAIIDASYSNDAVISLYEPTYDLIQMILLPRMLEKLDKYEIRHKYIRSINRIETYHPQFGDFVLRSMDNPDRIIGYESFRAHADELDRLSYSKAEEAWNNIIGRNRQRPKGVSSSAKNRVCVYSTPEGFNYIYDRWGRKSNSDYQFVRASSHSNPFLPKEYIESLISSYPEELRKAYIEGQFVNLTSGTVYISYNRKAHDSKETIREKEALYIGCDFNVTKQAATIYVRREGGGQWHAVSELVAMYDTPEMIRIINERWKNNGHHIVIYPDASGSNRHSSNASTSDISMLKQAGYEVRVRSTNPAVKDRVNATNSAFCKGLLYINSKACPTVADCLEQQAYDKNGEPDKKSGKDHQNDATTYPIAYEMPIQRPVVDYGISF